MGKEFLCTLAGTTNRVYNVSECLGSALQLALKPGCAGQQSGRVRSIKPCFSIRNNRVICPAFYAIVACHAHHQLPKLIVCHALSDCSQFQTHLLHDTLYIKFLFL